MTTQVIFRIVGGGQRVRQNIQNKQPTIIERVEGSDWPEKSGVAGCDAYANDIWHTDESRVKAFARGWAKGYGKVKFV